MDGRIRANVSVNAAAIRNAQQLGQLGVDGFWEVVCRDKNGNEKWRDVIANLITNEGLDHLLTVSLRDTGSPQDQVIAWFIGLTDGTPTVAAGDTLASHAGWTEVTAYDESNRQACTFAAVSSQNITNSAAPTRFTISANGTTVGGAFLASVNSGTSGVLFAVGAFSAGDKSLDDNDTLDVTLTISAADA